MYKTLQLSRSEYWRRRKKFYNVETGNDPGWPVKDVVNWRKNLEFFSIWGGGSGVGQWGGGSGVGLWGGELEKDEIPSSENVKIIKNPYNSKYAAMAEERKQEHPRNSLNFRNSLTKI